MKEFLEKVSDAIGGTAVMALLGFLLFVAGLAIGTVSNISASLGAKVQVTENMKYKSLDNTYVYGERVIAEIEEARTPAPNKISIRVTTSAGDTTVYGYDDDDDTSYTGYNVTDPAASDFINPSGTFRSTLTRNNGVVTGITFTQE